MVSTRLADILPQNGLVIPKTQLMSSLSVDQKARNAFKFNGIIAGPGKKHVDKNRQNVDHAVAQLLERGCREDSVAFYHEQLDGRRGGFLPFLNELRTTSIWSSVMPWHVFAEFVYRIVRAKVEWDHSPRPPFDAAEHSATARQVELLLETLPDFWGQCQTYIGSPYMIALHARGSLAEIERAAMDRAVHGAVSNGTVNGMESVGPADSLGECLDHGLSCGLEAMKMD